MAKRQCGGKPGCRNLVYRGCCAECEPKYSAKARSEATRESACKRGYGRRWQKTSAGYLRNHPLCVGFAKYQCDEREHAAEQTDHIIPVSGPDDPLFWDKKNWQGLCDTAHSRKTAREDGGFGGAKQSLSAG